MTGNERKRFFAFLERGNWLIFQDAYPQLLLYEERLYKILFGDSQLLKNILRWASNNPHTGSRIDYWPLLFHYVDEGVPGLQWKPRIVACKLTSCSPRIYSPKLELPWKNQYHESAGNGDWFHDWKVVYDLQESTDHVNEDIQNNYCRTIEQLELVTYAKKAISILD